MDIPARTFVEVAWSLLPRTPGELIVEAEVEANGMAVDVAPHTVMVADAPPFGARPNALPFHIDAATVGDFSITAPYTGEAAVLPRLATSTGIDALPAAPDPSGPEGVDARAADVPNDDTSAFPAFGTHVTAWLTLDAVRSAAIVRVLRGARSPGLVSHVPSLAVLFPNAIASGDASLDASFAGLSEAIRGTYERLFVKLRIPGYDVTALDLEDAATRRELLALLDRIGASGDPRAAVGSRADVYRAHRPEPFARSAHRARRRTARRSANAGRNRRPVAAFRLGRRRGCSRRVCRRACRGVRRQPAGWRTMRSPRISPHIRCPNSTRPAPSR